MTEVVEKYVKYYKTDFYNYDIETVSKMEKYDTCFWIIRETGTYLFRDPDLTQNVLTCDNYIYFAEIYKTPDDIYEYTEYSESDFIQDLKAFSINNLLQVYENISDGVIYGETRKNDLKREIFYPILSADDEHIYARRSYYLGNNIYDKSINGLKNAIYDEMIKSPYNVLQMEKRTADTWYL